MYLNTLKPAPGSKQEADRVGRGIGCGSGKTCGRGHKGQRARAGGFHRVGFEGGQSPIQRRLPKFGFTSRKSAKSAEITFRDLNRFDCDHVGIAELRAAGIISRAAVRIKLIACGQPNKPMRLSGIIPTAGARAVFEALGGTIEA